MTLVPIFEALGKMLQEKRKLKKKKVCGICTDVKVKLIKTRQGTTTWWLCFLLSGLLESFENNRYYRSMAVVWEDVGLKILP